MCPPQTAFPSKVGFQRKVPVCGENFHTQLVCLSHEADQNATMKERLDVFCRLPVFPWISIKRVKDHTFLPLFFCLQLWLTGKSAQSIRSGYACRKGMMVALWTYARRTNMICRVYGCRTEKRMWERHQELRADAGAVRKQKPRRKDKGR